MAAQFPNDRILERLLLAAVSIICVPSARADDSLVLSGLTFRCDDCSLVSDQPCRAALGKDRRILSCDDAVKQLLAEAVKDDNTETPAAAELRKFLLASTVSDDVAKSAFELLLSSETGRRALSQDAYSFAANYSRVLAPLVSDKKAQGDVWMAYWKLPAQEGVQLDGALRAAILAHRPELTADDLFRDLSIVDTDKDLQELKIYEDALTGSRDELAKHVHDARQYLERCKDSPDLQTSEEGCSQEQLKQFPGPVSKYLQRVQIQRLIAKAARGELTPEQILNRLRQVNYQDFRTPGAHDLVKKALEGAINSPFQERNGVLSDENAPVLKMFAENDRAIAIAYVALLCRHIADLWDQENTKRALELLNLSFKISPEPFEGRVKLVSRIADSPIWKNDPALREQFTQLVAAGTASVPDPEAYRNRLIGIFAILAGISFIWMIAVYTLKQRRYSAEQAALEFELEQAELQELLNYFELGEADGLKELTKKYRQKAKETHPDMQRSGSAEFQDLQTKYQRARELILKYTDDDAELAPEDDEALEAAEEPPVDETEG